MYKIFTLLFAIGFLVVGCKGAKVDALEIYTFKKDRLDQELKGNRGYIMGKPEQIPEKKRKAQRTIIGIDVEVPGDVRITDAVFGQWGKEIEETEEVGSEKVEARPVKTEAKVKPKVIEVKEEAGEDEWIK